MNAKNNRLIVIVLFGCFLGLFSTVCASTDLAPLYAEFQQAIETQNESLSLDVGDRLFSKLGMEYRTNAGFGALKSKLMASEFLSKQMIQQLQKATGMQMSIMTGNLLSKKVVADKKNGRRNDNISVAPAKSFYDTSTETFLKPIDISKLSDKDIKFLRDYYNIKLRKYNTDIAKAGQALTITNSNFKDTHHYVLVLPLLHFIEPQKVPLEVFPKWMKKTARLNEFSESCLMHYGLSYHAMIFAQRASELSGHKLYEYEYYKLAAEKCKKTSPNVAVDCLKRSIKLLKNKPKKQIAISYEIIQIWLDSGNYNLAASESKKMMSTFSKHPDSNKANWLYFYALSRANNTKAILKEIDGALENPRCKEYKPKMMYIKWWA